MNTDDGILVELAATIERLRSRMTQHEEHVGGHETRTRVILIDPLLRSLGWDPEDPEIVVHEYRAGSLKLDYALVDQGEVIGIVEAKALGSKLNDAAWGKYAEQLPGVPVIAFTNGDEWRFFRKSNKRIREIVKVSSGESFRAGFEVNQKIGRVVVQHQYPRPPENQVTGNPTPSPKGKVVIVKDNARLTVWHSLTEVKPAGGKEDRRPTSIKFENGEELAVTSWGKVYEQTGRYVDGRGLVRKEDHPVVLAEGRQVRKCAMNTTPVHPHGRSFAVPVKIREGVWMDKELGSNEARWRYSIRMLKRFGIDPSAVKVTFD